MSDREQLTKVHAALMATVADLQAHLAAAPAEPVEPPVEPAPAEPTPALDLFNFPAGAKFSSYEVDGEGAYRETPQAASVVKGNPRLTAQADIVWPRTSWRLPNLTVGKRYAVTVGHVSGNQYGYWVKVLDGEADNTARRYYKAELHESHAFGFVATQTVPWLHIGSGAGTAGRYREFSGVTVREVQVATTPAA